MLACSVTVCASFGVSGAGEPKVVGVPRDVVALVSADDAVAAVRVHADRVHDLEKKLNSSPISIDNFAIIAKTTTILAVHDPPSDAAGRQLHGAWIRSACIKTTMIGSTTTPVT